MVSLSQGLTGVRRNRSGRRSLSAISHTHGKREGKGEKRRAEEIGCIYFFPTVPGLAGNEGTGALHYGLLGDTG